MDCEDYWTDCDGAHENGCEVTYYGNPDNCGSCGKACLDSRVCVGSICAKLVFVSSALHDGNFGGLDAADALCQQLATNAGLVGSYKAWLSSSQAASDTRLHWVPDAAYVTKNHDTVAVTSLHNPYFGVKHPIDVTELGTSPAPTPGHCAPFAVFYGFPDPPPSKSEVCQDWTTIGGQVWVGDALETDGRYWDFDCLSPCSAPAHVYCVEQ